MNSNSAYTELMAHVRETAALSLGLLHLRDGDVVRALRDRLLARDEGESYRREAARLQTRINELLEQFDLADRRRQL